MILKVRILLNSISKREFYDTKNPIPEKSVAPMIQCVAFAVVVVDIDYKV